MNYTKEITVLSEKYVDKRISFSLVLDDDDKYLSVYLLNNSDKIFVFCLHLDLNRASYAQIHMFDNFMFGDSHCIFLTDIPSLLFDLYLYCSKLFRNE